MATIKIRQGDAFTITEVITGLTSLTGYTSKLIIKTIDGTAIDEITGSQSTLTVTYQGVNEDSKSYLIGEHKYETKHFDASDHVYTASEGKFIVDAPLNNDPS